MASKPLTTTQRGLGYGHQSKRQNALRDMREGAPCFRCELRGIVHPMTRAVIRRSADGKRWVAPLLELDHYPGRAFGGPQISRLSWKRCNRHHGGVLGNAIKKAMRAARPAQPTVYDRW